MVAVGAVEGAAQFHWHIVVGVGNPFDAEQGRAGGDLKQLALCDLGTDGADIFDRAHHAHTEIGLVHGIGGSRILCDLFGAQPLEGLSRKPHVLQDGRDALERENPSDLHHRVARTQGKSAGHICSCTDPAAVEDAALGRAFERHGVGAHFGLHSWTVFDPMWADEEWCEAGEDVITCEFRLQNPSVLFVRLGSNDAGSPSGFRFNVKEVIEFATERGVIPIIGTKADRFEGSNENNDILRALADEYDVPLWDFDRLADTLPGRGLDTDGVHLIIDELPHDYTDPAAFQRGHAIQDWNETRQRAGGSLPPRR